MTYIEINIITTTSVYLKYNADSGALINILVKAFFFTRADGEGQALCESHNSKQYNATSH